MYKDRCPGSWSLVGPGPLRSPFFLLLLHMAVHRGLINAVLCAWGPISPCTALASLIEVWPLPWPWGGAWCWAVSSHLCPCSSLLVWGLLTFFHSFYKTTSPTPDTLFPSFPSLASNLQKSDRVLEKSTSMKGDTEASLEWARENPENEICCCCSDPKSYVTLFRPHAHQALLCLLLKLLSIESVMPSNHLILCHPLFLLPSIFLSIRGFSHESALCIRWPKYWSFSFSISPSNE